MTDMSYPIVNVKTRDGLVLYGLLTILAPEGPLLLAMGMKGALPAGSPFRFARGAKEYIGSSFAH